MKIKGQCAVYKSVRLFCCITGVLGGLVSSDGCGPWAAMDHGPFYHGSHCPNGIKKPVGRKSRLFFCVSFTVF